jgi:hypothetical protein
MGVNVLLLTLAGSLVAIVATSIALLRSHSARSNSDLETSRSILSETKAEMASESTIQEAPAPFPEEDIPTGKTSVPAGVTAITGVSSVSASGAPLLVIATPKRRSRSRRRLPSTTQSGTSRKRRSVKRPHESIIPSPVKVPTITTEIKGSSSATQ